MNDALAPHLAALRALLAEHAPADAAEEDSLARIRGLLSGAAGDPFSRSHFDPGHLTASAIVVDPERTRCALIFHTKLQLWLQPGGHFEPGERDPLAAARREVLEETLLETQAGGALLDVDVHGIPARPGGDPAHDHFDLRFLLVAVSSSQLEVGDGVRAARWASAADRADLDLDPGLRRALAKVFA